MFDSLEKKGREMMITVIMEEEETRTGRVRIRLHWVNVVVLSLQILIRRTGGGEGGNRVTDPGEKKEEEI